MNKTPTIFLFALLCIDFLATSVFAQQTKKDVIYKRGGFLIHTPEAMKIDLIEKGKPQKNLVSKGDTLYVDNGHVILGDRDKMRFYKNYGVFRKYKIPYKFEMYKKDIYQGKLAAPNFRTDQSAYQFRTQIKNQCKEQGINFAGHCTLVHWGCGSECEQIAIIDRINGDIHFSKLKECSPFYTQDIKSNSSLIIMNHWMLKGFKGYVRCSSPNAFWKFTFAKWNGNKLVYLPKLFRT